MFFRRKPVQAPALLVFGLGNPGLKYAATRHNVGWWALDALAQHAALLQRKETGSGRAAPLRTESRHRSQVDFCRLGGVPCALIKPLTYMNLSGGSVAAWLREYPPARFIVLCDDIALPPGKARLRQQGSSGGQRGLQDIIDTLGHGDFARLRIGIGAPPLGVDAADYVLSEPSPAERGAIEAALLHVVQAVLAVVGGEMERAQRELANGAGTSPSDSPPDPGR